MPGFILGLLSLLHTLLRLQDGNGRLGSLGLDGSLDDLRLNLLRHRLGLGLHGRRLNLPGVALARAGILADGLARERGEALRDHLFDIGRRELRLGRLLGRLDVLGRGGLGDLGLGGLGGLGGGGGLGGLGGHVVFPFVVDFWIGLPGYLTSG